MILVPAILVVFGYNPFGLKKQKNTSCPNKLMSVETSSFRKSKYKSPRHWI